MQTIEVEMKQYKVKDQEDKKVKNDLLLQATFNLL